MWCREPELNWRHRTFQARALPTELSRRPAVHSAAGRVGLPARVKGPTPAARRTSIVLHALDYSGRRNIRLLVRVYRWHDFFIHSIRRVLGEGLRADSA